MLSTLTRETALSVPTVVACAGPVDALVLPAATCAPAALVIAVDVPVSQETSVLVQDVVAGGKADMRVAASAAAPAAFRNRTHVQGPPSRGTPV